jgi:choline transport protein
VISWQSLVAAVSYGCATQLQGVIILTRPSYEPQLWHATLISYAVSLFGLFVNTYLGRILPRVEALLLIFYIAGFFGVLIPLAYLAPHRSAAEVFTVFQNLGGWPSMGLSFFVGWASAIVWFVGECLNRTWKSVSNRLLIGKYRCGRLRSHW